MVDNTLKKEHRIAWIDIYKGIAICLVVVGHATGQFNSYIYQFHMAAFFFISGYTASRKNRSVSKALWDEIYALLLPYFSVFLFMVLAAEILTKLGIYDYFFTPDMAYLGMKYSIVQFLLHGNCYMWLLGAGWFVIVLFTVRILHLIVLKLSNENTGAYFLLVGLLYIAGYYLVGNGHSVSIGFVENDLACIGLGFYGLGFLLRKEKVFENIAATKFSKYIIFLVNILILYFYAVISPTTVNYPTRSFNNPIIDAVMGLNGCFLLYFVSMFFEKISSIKRGLTFLGKNTLGIVFFHFQFFKIAFGILYLLGIVPLSYIREFLPTDEIGKTWWWLISIICILASVAEWRALTAIKGVRFFFAQDKALWGNIYDRFRQSLIKRGVMFPDNILGNYGYMLGTALRKPFVVLGVAVICLICIPLWNQGIMCNDELQYYFWSRQGIANAYNHFRVEWIAQGRFLSSIFTPIWMYLSMIGKNICEYRIIPVFSILLNVVLFGTLLYRLFKNKYFSIFCCFVIMAFLPITFAPAAPNAYTTTFGIPFSFLLGALNVYIDYIDKPDKKIRLLYTSGLMLIAFSSYEIFVTYVPLFCLIALLKRGDRDMKQLVKIWMLPVLTGIGYFALYILCRIKWPSSYMGNSIGFTLPGAWKILTYLGKISFPGSFLSNPTYKYLNEIYHELQLIDYVRIMALIIGLLYILCRLIRSGNHTSQIRFSKVDLYVVITALIYCSLPALPLAISSMYQDNVGESTGFIALPTTYFTYFSATFLCCYLIWKALSKVKETTRVICLSFLLVSICLPVQYMNSNFSVIQHDNFVRLQNIERFLTTSTVTDTIATKIYSTDIFETRLSLGVHASYWQDELARQGKMIQIIPYTTETLCEENSYYLSYVDDECFVLEGSDVVYLAFTGPEDEKVVELQDGMLIKLKLERPIMENGYYIYVVDKANK